VKGKNLFVWLRINSVKNLAVKLREGSAKNHALAFFNPDSSLRFAPFRMTANGSG
jgi:hypothetical protein